MYGRIICFAFNSSAPNSFANVLKSKRSREEKEDREGPVSVLGRTFGVRGVVDDLNKKVGPREIAPVGNSSVVREASVPYTSHSDSEMGPLRPQNTLPWDLTY